MWHHFSRCSAGECRILSPKADLGGSSEAVVSGVDFEGAGATVQPAVTRLPTELGPAGCNEAAKGK